jgi:hypothetical protein
MIFQDIEKSREEDADRASWTWKELVAYYGILGLSMFVFWLIFH